MKPEIKAKWVAALRSGKYKQTKEQLRRGDSFCCLGVLCELHSKETGRAWSKSDRGPRYMSQITGLPATVQKWAGLKSSDGDKVKIRNDLMALAEHNDDGRKFKTIADAIEAQL